MEKSYEEITLDELIRLYMTDLTAEIKLDADRKTVSIMTLGIAGENLKNAFMDAIDPIKKMVQTIADSFAKTYQAIVDTLKPLMHWKLSKKRFCKLLQAHGIQRNEINKIVANNKEPYTYMRLYQTLDKYEKR